MKVLINKAKKEGIELYSDRFEKQQPQCQFGISGVCCKNCFAGPCRIIPNKQEKGICGADADLIVARNLLRAVAAGASCHTDHAREVALTLLKVSEGKSNYKIKNENKLKELAKRLGKKGKTIKSIAKQVALEALEDFRRQKGLFHKSEGDYLNWLKINAPKERVKLWNKLGILPLNADEESSHALHQTTMGCDADPKNLLLSTLRMGLVDGYAGLTLAKDMQDVLFGVPALTKSEVNLGVIKDDHVNIVVHGHVPLLSEKIVEWSKKLEKEAKMVGAEGINVVGMCCTGNEVLMRLGIPLAGHILQQELAIVTGAVEAVVVDTQCIYPSLQDLAACYHTKLISTLEYVRFPRAMHIPFNVNNANQSAKKIVLEAIAGFKKRDKTRVLIPKQKSILYGGFSVEAILNALSKLNKKDPLKPLIDALKNKEIKGIVAIIGCRNPKLKGTQFHEELTRLLIKNDVLVVGTGCWAHSAAQSGLMTPQATLNYAGPRLKKFLIKLGKANGLDALPPCWHMGSCVDNSRVIDLLTRISEKTKISIKDLPVAVSAPEFMTEKAVAIAAFALCLGLTVHLNPIPPVTGSSLVSDILTKNLEKITGGKIILATKPESATDLILETIKQKNSSTSK